MSLTQDLPRYEIGWATDAGRKRKDEPNQDALQVINGSAADAFSALLVVADGLGGYRGGQIASNLVIQAFQQGFQHSANRENFLGLLETCARKAHMAIRLAGSRDINLGKMGSTVVAAVIVGDRLDLLNVGDSRAYLVHGDSLLQISEDHSWVADEIRSGRLTKKEALLHPNRSRLNMSISAKRPDIQPFKKQMALDPQDVIILCSDGLWGVVPETLIWTAATEMPPQVAADKLVELANSSKGPDNISIVVARRADVPRKSALSNLEDTNPGIE